MAPRLADRTSYGRRECCRCHERKPLEDFREGSGICHECYNAYNRQLYAEGRTKRNHAKELANKRLARARDRRKYLRYNQEYRKRVKADPTRHAEMNERRRIEYRLKREREGVELEEIGHPEAMMVHEPRRKVPVAALREAFVRSQMSPNEVAKRMGHDREGHGGGEGTRVLRLLGLKAGGKRNDRKPSGPKLTVEYAVAVRLAEALGVDPTDVGI